MLLRGGCIVNSDRKFEGDILIENNLIKQIGQNIVVGADTKVIDVTNKIIIPGGIDPSTHFNLSADHRDSLRNESMAALAGGTTTIVTLVKQENGLNSVDNLKSLQLDLKSKLFCNYGFYVEIDPENEESIKNMESLTRNYGINSFLMTLTSAISPRDISVLKKCRDLNCLLRLRARDTCFEKSIEEELISNNVTGPEGFLQSRCLENEIESIYKILKLHYSFPCGLLIPQVMNEDIAKIISEMKKQGRSIFSETITAALGLSNDKYFSNNWDEAASIITDPPLRQEQNTALIRSIHCGDIDMLASQHTTINCGKRSVGKRDFRDIPRGIIGVEERLTMLWDKGVKTGIISECEFVAATSTNAAKLFNLYPERGHIAVGSVADLVIWNPDKIRAISLSTQHLKTDANIFEGMSCRGVPEIVIVNGALKFQLNEFIGNANGEKIDLKNNCKFLMDKVARFESLREFGKLSIKREHCDIEYPEPIVRDGIKSQRHEINQITKEVKNDPLKMQRPLTSSGNRNMQDSSFSLSGSQIDDEKPLRSTIRTNHPPGGKSSLIF